MTTQYLLDFLLYPLQWLNFDFKKIFSTTWRGERPGMALVAKLFKDVDIPEDATLYHLDHDSLKVIQEGTAYFYGQIIKENGPLENCLLEKSSLKFFPHEVVLISIKNSQNELVCSEVYHGGQYWCRSEENIRSEINKLCFKARKRGLTIEEIEVAHTHPSLEVLVEYSGESKFIFNGLSKSDKETAHRIATFLDFPLRIKAITPSANYSMLF